MMFLRRNIMPFLSLILLVCACDTPVAVKKSCGDGFIDPGEACDGDNLPARGIASSSANTRPPSPGGRIPLTPSVG
jgi:hypothetical protein